jgi:hypothetical protein
MRSEAAVGAAVSVSVSVDSRSAEGVREAGTSTRDWAALRAKYVNAAMADGQGGDLATGVRHWVRFTSFGRHISPVRCDTSSSPLATKLAEEALLMDFVLWLVLCKPLGRSIAIDTAVSYLGTVQAWHRRRFGYRIAQDLDASRLRDMLKGMRRQINQPAKRVRYGVRTQTLAAALAMELAIHAGDGRFDKLDKQNWRAALTTAFCGLLRAAEFALQRGDSWDLDLNLSRADLDFYFEGGVRHAKLMMRPSKNGRHLRGKTVALIFRGGGSLVDPVEELWKLIQMDPVPEEKRATTPLFRLRTSGRPQCMTVEDVRRMVKALAKAHGEDPARVGAHSLRIGGASAALAAGVPPAVIRLAGRWNSDLWEIYARMSREAAASVTSTIGSTAFHDLERGFHADELELLPQELDVEPEFDDDELDIEMNDAW